MNPNARKIPPLSGEAPHWKKLYEEALKGGTPAQSEYESHGVWSENPDMRVRMWKHLPTGAMTFEDHPKVRERGLFIYPY